MKVNTKPNLMEQAKALVTCLNLTFADRVFAFHSTEDGYSVDITFSDESFTEDFETLVDAIVSLAEWFPYAAYQTPKYIEYKENEL